MPNDFLYTPNDIIRTYDKVHDHLLARHIIKMYSTNKDDIRDIALQGLHLNESQRVLEIGCGYGFFIEKLKGRLHEKAAIIGIDLVENNREPFLNSTATIQYRGEFIAASADIIREMPESLFDVVISSYSLYFFPHLLRDISRILIPQGVFIALTHSKDSLKEVIRFVAGCMRSSGIKRKEPVINKLFMNFSRENGESLLRSYFDIVERIDFANSINFSCDNIEDCIFYVNKKPYLIYKEIIDVMPEKLEIVQQCVESRLVDFVKRNGSISVNKDDAVFRCFAPKNYL
jgi:ubiquinone/menaquinone biosynthesis C-methylase UbiE